MLGQGSVLYYLWATQSTSSGSQRLASCPKLVESEPVRFANEKRALFLLGPPRPRCWSWLWSWSFKKRQVWLSQSSMKTCATMKTSAFLLFQPQQACVKKLPMYVPKVWASYNYKTVVFTCLYRIFLMSLPAHYQSHDQNSSFHGWWIAASIPGGWVWRKVGWRNWGGREWCGRRERNGS